jgi:hypothetical protein
VAREGPARNGRSTDRGGELSCTTFISALCPLAFRRLQQEPNWDSPGTRALAGWACYDCHSNGTQWPWYSNVAPLSWVLQYDVVDGRRELNYSRWDQLQREAGDSAKEVQDGDMPPAFYPLAHPAARLSAAERDALIRGLQATFGSGGS